MQKATLISLEELFIDLLNYWHQAKTDVISLYVNEDLILQRVKEERDIVEREFEKILEDFSNNKIGVDVLDSSLKRY